MVNMDRLVSKIGLIGILSFKLGARVFRITQDLEINRTEDREFYS